MPPSSTGSSATRAPGTPPTWSIWCSRKPSPICRRISPRPNLIEQLFAFVDDNRARLNKILFDPAYLENPALFAEATKDFVKRVLSSAMGQHEIGEIEKAKIRAADTYRFTWPDYESDKAFPYKDEDG